MKAAWGRAGRMLAAATGFFLAGCFLTGGDSFFLSRGGGGEDFPNTVIPALGKIAAEDVASSADWEQLATLQLPEIPSLDVFGSLRIEPIGLSKPLGKRALSKGAAEGECDTSYYDYNNEEILAFNRGRKIVCEEDGTRRRNDTLVFWIERLPTELITKNDTAALIRKIEDSAILIEARGTITYKAESRRQAYSAFNFDSLGTLDYAEYVTTVNEPSSRTVQRVRIYGKDGAYQSADAPPAYYESLKKTGLDTLDWQRMTDADGDSAFWKRGDKQAKGIVNFSRKTRDPADAPATDLLTVKMRAEIRHEAGKNDSLVTQWYFDQRLLRNGASSTFSFRGAGADSVLRASDSADLVLDTVFANYDTSVSYRASYRLVLGENPADISSASMARFGLNKAWRRGKLRGSSVQFISKAAAPMGRPFVGEMSSRTGHFNGDSVYVDGDIRADGMVLTLRRLFGGKVELYRLVLDREGNEKEPTVKLPLAAPAGSTRVDTTRATVDPAPATADTLKASPQSGARTP